MPTTSNFGWTTPADTDLVKDGAAAIRTLGNGIDTSFVDLKGGTTGQILSKASNTDLDFTWTSDATGIQATIFDAKGDLIAASAADTAARLASSGVNGDVLTVDTSTSTGLKWAAAGGWSPNLTLLNTGGTALTGAGTITVNVSSYDSYFIFIDSASSTNASAYYRLRFNSDSGNNYGFVNVGSQTTSVFNQSNVTSIINLARNDSTAGNSIVCMASVLGGKTTGLKIISATSSAGTGSNAESLSTTAYWNNSAAITSISLLASTGNFDNGTIFIYGG